MAPDLRKLLVDPFAAAQDGSAELFERVRGQIVSSLYWWTKAICQYPDLTPRCHLPLCLFLQQEEPRAKVVEYPRRHLKTTIVTISYPLWRFARAAILGFDLTERIAIVSSTHPNSRRFLGQIKRQVEANKLIHAFVPELVAEFGNEETWNQDAITFPRAAIVDGPSIDTYGAGTKVTSRHVDGIIEDDMINEENWDSPDAVSKAVQLHQLAENLLEDAKNSWRITNENSWNLRDLNSHILENEPETAIFSVSASTGLNHNRSRLLPTSVIDLTQTWDGQESIWQERFDKATLARLRQKLGALIYNCQYENQPFDPDIVDFREEWLQRYEWGRTKDGKRYLRIVGKPGDPIEIIPLDALFICAAFDPAMGEKVENDRSAIVVVGVDERMRVFLLSVDAVRRDPFDVVLLLIERCIEWKVQMCGVESVLFSRLFMGILERACSDWNEKHPDRQVSFGLFVELKPLKGRDKDGRIRFLLSPPAKEGRIHYHASQTEFLDEYIPFPRGKTKDVLDALAYTAMLWTRGFTPEEVDLAERQATWPDDGEQRDPVTGY